MPRNFVPGDYYHVIIRGNNRAVIFHDSSDYQVYLEILQKVKQKFSMRVFHYVLMPNHVHLLLACDTNLSKAMHYLNLEYSKKYRKRHVFVGHIWQGRYKCFHIDSDAYLLACGNYIEMNPFRAGLVQDSSEWPYSSIRTYTSGAVNRLVDEDPLFVSMGCTEQEKRARYLIQLTLTRIQPVPFGPGPNKKDPYRDERGREVK